MWVCVPLSLNWFERSLAIKKLLCSLKWKCFVRDFIANTREMLSKWFSSYLFIELLRATKSWISVNRLLWLFRFIGFVNALVILVLFFILASQVYLYFKNLEIWNDFYLHLIFIIKGSRCFPLSIKNSSYEAIFVANLGLTTKNSTLQMNKLIINFVFKQATGETFSELSSFGEFR